MKYLLFLLPVLLISCGKPTDNTSKDYGISNFDYNGHSYIAFERTLPYQGYLGIVRNPDCKCHEK